MTPNTRRRLTAAGIAAGFLVLAGMNLSLRKQVEELSRQMHESQHNTAQWLRDIHHSLSDQETIIRDAMAAEASLFTGMETLLDDQDGGLVLSVSLVPKEFTPGDRALLALDTGESIPMTAQENGRLTGSLPCSLRWELKPSVILLRGETRYSEALPSIWSDSLLLSGECGIDTDTAQMELTFDPTDTPLTLSGLTVEIRALHPTDASQPGTLLASIPASRQSDGRWLADLGTTQDGSCLYWISGQTDGGLELRSTSAAGEVTVSSGDSSSYAYGSFELIPVVPAGS